MTAWPPAIAGTPAAAVLERAIAGSRLAHSLLLHGDEPELLSGAAAAIAARLLGAEAAPRSDFGIEGHPDCFVLRPAGKMRQISAEATRDLIGKVQVSPTQASCKVAILHEVDRMNLAAANIFLKTLEEPPARTVLILLTTRPYALLPTIRSRCFHFRLGVRRPAASAPEDAPWSAWIVDYRSLLGRLSAGRPDKAAAADHVMAVYGLVARFGVILRRAVEQSWEKQKGGLPAELDEEEKLAIETGLANGLRARLLAEVAEATRDYVRGLPPGNEIPARRAFPAAIARLEHDASLLRLNLNESAALEDFLLASLRIWSAG